MNHSVATAVLILGLAGPSQAQLSLELSDCRISAGPGTPGITARCGDFDRPLDPADPERERISLRVAVVPALSLEPAPDALVPIAGGPGASSIEFYAAWAGAFERVRQNRDILLVDQRGTGQSAPMSCDVDDDIVDGVLTTDDTLQATRECLESLPHDPRYFTTSIAVTDLEAVRAALGYESLNLYGSSYGTRVAQHYARRYPETTRSIVIDGVVPPQVPLGPEIATESQRAMDRVLDRCAAEAACADQFPDIRDEFDRLLVQLAAAPVTVELASPQTGVVETLDFSYEQMAVAFRLLLYSDRTIAILPLVIHEAANGNFAPLAAQFRMAVESLSTNLAIGMHNAVMCTEDWPFIDFDAVDYEALEASYLGPAQLQAIDTMCSVWPQGPIDDDLLTPLATDTPVLLLSGDADPVTPPRYAELAAVDLQRAWLLTGTNQGHGLGAVGCMPRVIGAFVERPGLQGGDADCLGDAFSMPFFIDFSGPTP